MARYRHKLFFLFFTVVVVTAACSSSDPKPEVDRTDPAEAYLAGLNDAIGIRAEAAQRFDQLLGPVFPTFATDEVQNFVLLNALRDEDLPGVVAQVSEMILALDPPEEYAEDHVRITSQFDLQRDRASRLAAAIDEGDLPKIHLRKAELESGLILLTNSFPRECSGDLSQAPPFIQARCSGEELPGGAYGVEVEQIFIVHVAEFGPRASLGEGLTAEQLMEALTYVQPAIIETFDATIERMNALTPPTEYEVGHQVLLDFFTELRSTAFAIDRAVAAGDADAVDEEFDRSGDIAETALSRLPENYRMLTVPLFGPE